MCILVGEKKMLKEGKIPLEEGMTTYSSVLAQTIPWTEEPGGYSPWGHKESDPSEVTELSHTHTHLLFSH